MAYTIVAICVLLLKYENDDDDIFEYHSDLSFLKKAFNTRGLKNPTKYTSSFVTSVVLLYIVFCCWTSLVLTFMLEKLLAGNALAIILIVIPIVAKLILMTAVERQPKSSKLLTFSVPFNPWFPGISIMINIHLLFQLDVMAWARFGIWIVIGLAIYCFYGRRNSKMKEEPCLITNEFVDEF